MERYCLALDLVQNEALIAEYEQYHVKNWPEVYKSIRESGIEDMEIYRIENRLFMIMEVNDGFSFEKKTQMDLENPIVQEWENLMWKYQQALPTAKPNEKWLLMKKIYDLKLQ